MEVFFQAINDLGNSFWLKMEQVNIKPSYAWKRKTPNEFSTTLNSKREIHTCGYCKKKGYPKEQHRKLKQKEHDNKTKGADHKGQIPNVLKVYTHYLSNCK